MEKQFHASGNQKRAGVSELIPDKVDFKSKTIRRDRRNNIMKNGSIHQKDVPVVNIYVLSIRVPKYIKQKKQI